MHKLAPFLLVALLVGCPSTPTDVDMGPTPEDMTDTSDAAPDLPPEEDMSSDMANGDMAQDDMGPMGPEGECTWPAPEIAGTPQTNALADAPARCGQPEHTWLRQGPLGQILEYAETETIRASTLRVAIATQGVTPPEQIRYDSNIELFRYTTQDRGQLVEATSLLGWPEGAEEIKGVMLLLHGTSGFTDKCAPSLSPEGKALVALFTSLGYLVVAPDFIGMKALGEPSEELHSYLSGQATAIASLDALRALPQLDPERRGGFCPGPETLVFGGSQGGHAALWVDRLAPYYAREIKLLGTVATVPPMDLIGQIARAIRQEVDATANTLAFLAATSEWYGADTSEVLESPYDVDIPAALRLECGPDLNPKPTLEQLFTSAIRDAAVDTATFKAFEPWGCMAAENSLTDTSIARINEDDPSYGVLVITGEDDDLVNTPIERAAYPTVCASTPATYLECAGARHGPATFYSVGEIVEFFEARLAGEAFVKDCSVPAPTRCSFTPDP